MEPIALVLHGGAGTLRKGVLSESEEEQYLQVLSVARDTGYSILENGKSSIDAVEAVVKILEDYPLFNAGKGSVFNSSGTHEMDASIMDGSNRKAGAVALINGIKNPIRLAREVMDQTQHVFLAGEGALEFAKLMNHPVEDPSYFFNKIRFDQWQKIKGEDGFQLDHTQNSDDKFGTVGAVALDSKGNLASATSTGGMTNKRFGRIGDTPIIGAGTYANNNTCAVSCTGSGEFFIRGMAAYDVSALMEFQNLTLEEAAEKVIHSRLKKLNGDGGLIAVDSKGNITMPFNTEGMYRAFRTSQNFKGAAIYGK
jgi:L-asparaginase / beta-aspartyl-peptidase